MTAGIRCPEECYSAACAEFCRGLVEHGGMLTFDDVFSHRWCSDKIPAEIVVVFFSSCR